MPATIIVGGQFGSEGKGKIAALTAQKYDNPIAIRCGGPNSGHTTVADGGDIVLRQLPAAATHSNALLAISAGCVVDEAILAEEIDRCQVDPARLVIDPRAVLINEEDFSDELSLVKRIGSTGSGTGAALARRILRGDNLRLAGDSRVLGELATVSSVAPVVHAALQIGRQVIVEGTQGFGLSLLHGANFPFVTSKDTTAAAFAMEVGLSPRDVDDIILVVRTFPIRVAGNSGPLLDEITWEQVAEISHSPRVEPEFTSVTKKVRRVGLFDLELVKMACRYNRPTSIAVMGLDRLDYSNRGVSALTDLSPPAVEFLSMLKTELDCPISWCGTGFGTLEAIHTSHAVLGLVNV